MAGTPAQNGNSAAGKSDFSRRAEELAQAMWFTPNGGRKLQEGTSPTGMTPDGIKRQVGLENQTRLWTTPQAHDVTARGSGQKPTAKAGNACLATDAMTWGTPAPRTRGAGGPNQSFGAGGIPLPAQAAQWTTPSATDNRRGGKITGGMTGTSLVQQVGSVWPTPAARDHKGENSPDHLTNGTGRLHLDQLPNAVAFLYSRPAHLTVQHGPTLSQLRPIWRPLRASLIASHGRAVWLRLWNGRDKARLNPLFVEWLMGWPSGHALCACSATEFTHWQRRMRGALLQLPTASGPWIWEPPAEVETMKQGDLFA